jgi:hypothetical protein
VSAERHTNTHRVFCRVGLLQTQDDDVTYKDDDVTYKDDDVTYKDDDVTYKDDDVT